jgi:NitT/TauT family transport system substrate-binding protein
VIKAFLRAFSKGVADVLADPDAAVKTVKARDPIIDEVLERRRLKLAIQGSIATADAKAEGFGEIREPRLALMASQVNDAFGLKERLDPARIFNSSFLPPASARNIFAK